MKNKIFYYLFIAILAASCSSNELDDPLIIPPGFNIMPKSTINNKSKETDKILPTAKPVIQDDDIDEIKRELDIDSSNISDTNPDSDKDNIKPLPEPQAIKVKKEPKSRYKFISKSKKGPIKPLGSDKKLQQKDSPIPTETKLKSKIKDQSKSQNKSRAKSQPKLQPQPKPKSIPKPQAKTQSKPQDKPKIKRYKYLKQKKSPKDSKKSIKLKYNTTNRSKNITAKTPTKRKFRYIKRKHEVEHDSDMKQLNSILSPQ